MPAADEDHQTTEGVEAKADVSFTLGDLLHGIKSSQEDIARGMSKLHEFLQPNHVQSPLVRRLTKAQAAAASALTYMFIDCGFPPAGRVWDVRRISVTGPDPFTTLAGVSVIAFASILVPGDSNTEPPSFADIVLPSGSTVPNSASWGRDEFTLLNQEHLIIGLKGLANSQQIQVSAQIEDWREDDKYSWMAP